MRRPETVGIGIIGLGVVGTGVVRILQRSTDRFRDVNGLDIRLHRIAVRDRTKPRSVELPQGILTDRPEEVIRDPNVQIVVELIGGTEPARTLCLQALKSGKNVVTANKALLAERGDELFGAADRSQVELAFEASVCGGIPIIRSLTDGLVANHVESIFGILNGTSNYILTRMTDEGGSFGEMLKAAQERGYAEADPILDLDGTDAAQKLALLCRIAFRVSLPPEQILKEGIAHITPLDIEFAAELGYTIKLLAVARGSNGRIEARVHPALLPSSSLLANIKDAFNAVEIVGDAVGPQVFYGQGAGELPTASAVVSDILSVAERKASGRAVQRPTLADLPSASVVPPEDLESSFYCRFSVHDRPGVLAQISRLFSDHGISIATVIQHGRSTTGEEAVSLIMTTHEAKEAEMREAIQEIENLSVVTGDPRVIHIVQP